MNRFEQLIEYVINDEEQKARELFHDIVVEKSREIYENLMSEEAEEDLDEAADEELDEAEEELDEEMMGGDASDDLIDNVETEEQMSMEDDESFDDAAEEDGEDLTKDMETDHDAMDDMGSSEPATKDDIMNLEDKLDELMAEFESAMGGDMGSDGDMMGPDEGGDAIEMDDTEEMTDDMGMMEAINLKAAPAPVTTEQGNGKAGPVAFNSGAAGMASKPVRSTGDVAQGRPAPTTKDLIGDFQNKAGASMKDQKPATKPHLAQATGVNTKSPLPGRKG